MQNGRFRRAIEEAHEDDMSRRYESGYYVSDRIWMLANEAQRRIAFESDPDVMQEYEEQNAA